MIVLPPEEVLRILGPRYLKVWEYLCRVNDHAKEDTICPGVLNISERTGLPERTVRRALALLTELGFIRFRGARFERSGKCRYYRSLVASPLRNGRVEVTEEIQRKAEKMKNGIRPGRGGKRAGTGPKKKPKKGYSKAASHSFRSGRSVPENLFKSGLSLPSKQPEAEGSKLFKSGLSPSVQIPVITESVNMSEGSELFKSGLSYSKADAVKDIKAPEGDPLPSVGRSVATDRKAKGGDFEKPDPKPDHRAGDPEGSLRSPPASPALIGGAADSLRSSEPSADQALFAGLRPAPHGGAAPPSTPAPGEDPLMAAFLETLPPISDAPREVGVVALRAGPKPQPRDLGLLLEVQKDAAPRYEDPRSFGFPSHPPRTVTHYWIPAAPKIPVAAALGDQLEFLALWFNATVRAKTGKWSGIRVVGGLRPIFEDAVELLVKHEIRPAAWIAWSYDQFLQGKPANLRRCAKPPTKFLISPKRLIEKRWGFRARRAEAFDSPLCVPLPDGVFPRYLKAFRRAEALPPEHRNQIAVEEILEEFFPEGYEAACKKSREKSQQVGQGFKQRLARGEWIWEAKP